MSLFECLGHYLIIVCCLGRCTHSVCSRPVAVIVSIIVHRARIPDSGLPRGLDTRPVKSAHRIGPASTRLRSRSTRSMHDASRTGAASTDHACVHRVRDVRRETSAVSPLGPHWNHYPGAQAVIDSLPPRVRCGRRTGSPPRRTHAYGMKPICHGVPQRHGQSEPWTSESTRVL